MTQSQLAERTGIHPVSIRKYETNKTIPQPEQIRDRLGHEDIKTTLNTYGHLYPNTDQKMAEQLESEYREEIR